MIWDLWGKIKSMKKVLVLMSTYNGERFLREQLESLLKQVGVIIEILIRDDGSSDRTIELLDEYCLVNSNISYYRGQNVKPAKSFLELIENAPSADYYAFCDQDDVWEEDKLISAVERLEQENNQIPLLYVSNLKVVDKELHFLRNAHKKNLKTNKRYTALTEAVATGCTMVFNNCLLNLIRDNMPENVSMHDAWVYLVCIFMGKVIYDPIGKILYRQHENNVIGIDNKSRANINAIKRAFDCSEQPRYLNAVQLKKHFFTKLSKQDQEKISKVTNYKKNTFTKLRLLFDLSLHASTIKRDIKYRIRVLLGTL